jgi:hypothetical protein
VGDERDAIERELQERASRGGLQGGVSQDDAERLGNVMQASDATRKLNELEAEDERQQQEEAAARRRYQRYLAIVAVCVFGLGFLWWVTREGPVQTPARSFAPLSSAPAITAAPVAPVASATPQRSASGIPIICGLPGGPSCAPRP